MAGIRGKSGRKKTERVVRHFMSEYLDELDPKTDRKRIAEICRKMIDNAVGGDLNSAREVFDRLEGKATAHTESKHDIDVTLELVKRIAR